MTTLFKHESALATRLAWLLLAVWLGVCSWGIGHGTAPASEILIGKATYYTRASCQREGTSGVYTASGEVYDGTAFTAALPHRARLASDLVVGQPVLIGDPIVMANSTNSPLYALVFASHNRTGVKIAQDIFAKYLVKK